jgi:hypothetical protein
MPAAVAARPRDERGYPVPAITPWEDGVPKFAATGTARTYLCAVERRCSICATPIEPGPVWRVVAGAEADAIEAAHRAGQSYLNRAPTAEAPGHRACMLYAAVVCPYLARPTARRGEAVEAPGLSAVKGTSRGHGGAVAAFAEVDFRYTDVVLFWFAGVSEVRPHQLGEEHLEALADLVALERAAGRPVPAAPDYLMDDEAGADRRFDAYLHPVT